MMRLIRLIIDFHSQVGLLDPRWVEERDKNITQKAREEVLLDIQIGRR